MNIPDLAVQLVLFLAGALISFYIAGHQTQEQGYRVIAKVLATLLMVGAVLWAGFLILWPSKPPATGLYDDFHDRAYDGKINTALWQNFQGQNCDIAQHDGAAFFSLHALRPEGSTCYLNMVQQVPFPRVGSFEARLFAEDGAQGDFSLAAVEYKTTGFQPNTVWLAQCGIIQTPKENKVELFFYINNSYPGGQPETYVTQPAAANQWYTMRLLLDQYGAGVWCFANDRELADFSPSRMDILKNQIFSRHLVGYWSPQSIGTYKADDVYVKPY